MIKLIHAADFHLDSAFSSLKPEQAAQRRREQRLALAQFSQLCNDCDIVLLSGDLFDSARIYRDTLDALKACFASIAAQIFIAPGNHDFLTSGCPYLTEDWGANVHIFTQPTLQRVHLDDLNCDVYGAAFVSPQQPALLQDFRVENKNAINLMVLHGDLQPASPYCPIRPEEIAASGLDYLALGHVHRRLTDRAGTTTYAYPGCLMGRGFDECGQKGILRVVAQKQNCNVDFLPLYTRKYEILTVNAGENALASIQAALPQEHQNDCYRIVLTGECNSIHVSQLSDALKSQFYSLQIVDQTLPKQSLWACVSDETLRGHFLRELKTQYDTADESEKQRIAKAAKLVLALMDGREVQV